MAVLETPAGFEPNSSYVAEQVMRFVEKRLQNFAPALYTVPARKRGDPAFSTDDPALAALLHDANVLFMGPGSPTYAVRQLRESLVWETLRACHRLGAALVLSSAATLAASRWTLPVYEIYKAGADLYWEPGLDLLADYGLKLLLVPHWNNGDGGSVLDTSRCYLGQARFAQLLGLLPAGADCTIVGIDESTALALDPARCMGVVLGAGSVTILRRGAATCYAAGEQFPLQELGDFRLPADRADRAGSDALEQAVLAGRRTAAAERAAAPAAPPAVQALLAERAAARAGQQWADADRLRDQMARLGWRVLDTANGQRLEPLPLDP
jgi:hypothetical protein